MILNRNQIINLDKFKIKLDLTQSIDRQIYLHGFYEKKQISYLRNICKMNKITHFLDIGANIGYYTLIFANIKNIYAFEPNKKSYHKLKENIKLNNQNVNTYNFALSNKNSNAEIWYTDINKMGGSSVFNEEDHELKKYKYEKLFKEKILLKKLDDVISFKNLNILIKIDVERHEKNVLEGMKKLINQNNIILQIEIFDERKKMIYKYLETLNLKFVNAIGHDHYFVKNLKFK